MTYPAPWVFEMLPLIQAYIVGTGSGILFTGLYLWFAGKLDDERNAEDFAKLMLGDS